VFSRNVEHHSGVVRAFTSAVVRDCPQSSALSSVLENMLGCVRSVARRRMLARCIMGFTVGCSVPSTYSVPEPGNDGPLAATAGSAGSPSAAGAGSVAGAAGTSATAQGGASGATGGSGGAAGTGSSVPDAGLIPDVEPGLTGTTNLFSALLGVPREEVDAKLTLAVARVFGIGTGEPNLPVRESGYRLYYELPQDPSLAFIWAADSSDIRSEGMSYGMMIAVQMDLQSQYDRLWGSLISTEPCQRK
jgi:hypothetical protein